MDYVQSLWIGPTLRTIEILCIKSFLANGHNFVLYTYGDVKNIPEGTIVRDANEIIEGEKIFRTHNGSVAHFADWFRWELLYKNGGIWVDMDMVAFKPFNFEDDIIIGGEKAGFASIGVLKFPPNSDICKIMANMCINPNSILPYDNLKTRVKKVLRRMLGNKLTWVSWGESGGPVGLTRLLEYKGLLEIVKPYTWFYVVPGASWQCLFDDTFALNPEHFEIAYGIHLWNEFMRRSMFNPDLDSKGNSIYAQLCNKYGIELGGVC